MNGSMTRNIEAWEDEGGAVPLLGFSAPSMRGIAAQVEWAERIKLKLNAEFDGVAASFGSIAGKQGVEVMSREQNISRFPLPCNQEQMPARRR
jgi:hypothetical protein